MSMTANIGWLVSWLLGTVSYIGILFVCFESRRFVGKDHTYTCFAMIVGCLLIVAVVIVVDDMLL